MTSTSSVWPVPTHNLDDLRRQVDLRDLVAAHWGPGKKTGKAVQYKSPWREDGRHGSLTVYADGWKDFGGSGEAGDVFTWIMREYRLDFPGAVRWLQDYLGNPQPLRSSHPRMVASSAQHEPPSLEWQQAARQALAAAQAQLWQTPAVLDYLHQARGLTDNTIRRAGLGYNPGWIKTGCRKPDGQSAFLPPGIVIPIIQGDTLWALRLPVYHLLTLGYCTFFTTRPI